MDFSRIYKGIEAATKGGVPLGRGMRQLIDVCARERPHHDWKRLAELDFEKDFSHLRDWFAQLLDESPPPTAATGLWFGLFNPLDDCGEMVADLYVTGGVHDPQDIDWTCSPIWEPDGRYAGSQLLTEVCRIGYRGNENELGNDAEYPLALAYACFAVRDLANDFATTLGTPERVLFVGFDSGDLLCVGAIAPTGVRFSTASESLQS
jgi:hypothetical protein